MTRRIFLKRLVTGSIVATGIMSVYKLLSERPRKKDATVRIDSVKNKDHLLLEYWGDRSKRDFFARYPLTPEECFVNGSEKELRYGIVPKMKNKILYEGNEFTEDELMKTINSVLKNG